MEHKYLNNLQILSFLKQFDQSQWDQIIEDLLLNSIKQINDIEQEEKQDFYLKEKEKKTNFLGMKWGPKIVTLKQNNVQNDNYLKQSLDKIHQEAEYLVNRRENLFKKNRFDDLNARLENLTYKK